MPSYDDLSLHLATLNFSSAPLWLRTQRLYLCFPLRNIKLFYLSWVLCRPPVVWRGLLHPGRGIAAGCAYFGKEKRKKRGVLFQRVFKFCCPHHVWVGHTHPPAHTHTHTHTHTPHTHTHTHIHHCHIWKRLTATSAMNCTSFTSTHTHTHTRHVDWSPIQPFHSSPVQFFLSKLILNDDTPPGQPLQHGHFFQLEMNGTP